MHKHKAQTQKTDIPLVTIGLHFGNEESYK